MLTCLHLSLSAQLIFEPIDNGVYPFLDEMAAAGHIRISTFARPFTRQFIAEQLEVLKRVPPEHLNARQRSMLSFYWRDYSKELFAEKQAYRRKDLFYYSDSSFKITINPMLGGSIGLGQNDTRIMRSIGGYFTAQIGHLGMYGSLRDHTVSDVLAAAPYLTERPGQNYKFIDEENRSDFNETTGGIGYTWNWGQVGLVKDRFYWGNSRRSASILSGKAPSFASLYLQLAPVKWLEFTYLHGWLVSEVLDSARTYLTPNGSRKVFTNKNMAANALTIKTNWRVDFTLGNSIIYSDNGIQPVYLIPFLFYKSADHTYNGTGSNELGQNSQFYLDVNVWTLRKFRFFATAFVDEISFSKIVNSTAQTNVLSLQGGAYAYNVLPNVHLGLEYTLTRPWTYRHQIASTTFASNQYTLGNYLGENADEWYVELKYLPWKRLLGQLSLWYARKGPEHTYEVVNGNANVSGLPLMREVNWSQKGIAFTTQYEVIHDALLFITLTHIASSGDSSYTPAFFQDNPTSLQMGFTVSW